MYIRALLLFLASSICFTLTSFAKNLEKQNWLEVKLGMISPASEDILHSAMVKVEQDKLDGLLITLDTPGGALESTRAMVKEMLASAFPIVVWVGPEGSRAGSAGAFITIAAHVAAMAPGTNIGAAHPIQADGKDIGAADGAKKIENDTAAFIESLAKLRGKNVEMSRSFVLTSASITAEEALTSGVIDLVAKNKKNLFKSIDGKKIELQKGQSVVLQSAGASTVLYEKSLKQKFLEILANPNLFYLLFVAGLIGLGFELTHPGVIFPGVAGGICMILALIATSVLPVSFGAMLLILAGVAFMAGEIFLPGFGVLGIGGLVAFVAGSVLLVDPSNESQLRISLYTIAPAVVAIVLTFFAISYLVVRSEKSPVLSGIEAMIGQLGVVIIDFVKGSGRVRVSGEDWAAKSMDQGEDLKKGDEVIVKAVEGLIVRVTRR